MRGGLSYAFLGAARCCKAAGWGPQTSSVATFQLSTPLPAYHCLSHGQKRCPQVNRWRGVSTSSDGACDHVDKHRLLKEIYQVAGREFNLDSPQQVSDVLFRDHGYRPPSTPDTGRGRPSVSKAALLQTYNESSGDKELLGLILKYKGIRLDKAGSTHTSDLTSATGPAMPRPVQMPLSATPTLLVDGTYLLFRSYFAMPQLSAKGGLPIGAVVGVCNALSKWVLTPWVDYLTGTAEAPLKVVVAFDTGKPSFRKELYPDYKAHRPSVPEPLVPQFQLVREACEAYQIQTLDSDGFEGDDVLATLTRQAVEAGAPRVTIMSMDKDLMQLVGEKVQLLDVYKNLTVGPQEVLEKCGVPPEQVGDWLALMGDSSDNIPGVPGVGSKTAARLLKEFGSLEGLYNGGVEAKPLTKKLKEQLAKSREAVLLSRELVRLRTDAPVQPAQQQGPGSFMSALPEYKLQDPEKLMSFFQKYGLQDLERRTAALLGRLEGSRDAAAQQ